MRLLREAESPAAGETASRSGGVENERKGFGVE